MEQELMKAFALVRMTDGQPDLPPAAQGRVNWTLCDRVGGTGWGVYLVAATGPDLKALDEQWDGFVGIVAVTDAGDVRWGELENPCADVVRTRLNTWLANHGYRTIPEQWINRQVVREIYERANARFDLAQFDIMDVA